MDDPFIHISPFNLSPHGPLLTAGVPTSGRKYQTPKPTGNHIPINKSLIVFIVSDNRVAGSGGVSAASQ